MIVIADTSGLIAASDRNAPESQACRSALNSAGSVVLSGLVLAELDHLAKARFGSAARSRIMDHVRSRVRSTRFVIPETTIDILDIASAVQRQFASLDLDLADGVNVALAAHFGTDVLLTLDHRDFRALRPLTSHTAFRLLPADGD